MRVVVGRSKAGEMRRWFGISALAVLVFGVSMSFAPPTSRAVIGGQFDGDSNPNVGMILASDDVGPIYSCSGTLIAPTVVLTNAHCVQDDPEFAVSRYEVSFEPEAFFDFPPSSLVNSIEGAPDPHPEYSNGEIPKGSAYLRYQEKDIGLLHLEQPASEIYPSISPEPIVSAGALDALPKEGQNTLVTQVGYGSQQDFPPKDAPYVDGTRNRSLFPLKRLTDRLAFGRANAADAHGYGMPCYGDSGSPWFAEGIPGIAVLHSFGVSPGTCSNGGGLRLDQGPARRFLRSRGLVP